MGLWYTSSVEDEPLVTAKVIADTFGIPRSTLYRLVNDGRIPAVDVTQPWHDRRQFRFCENDVRQAIAGRPRAPRPAPAADE
jgi:excisionase family DNA binding protein